MMTLVRSGEGRGKDKETDMPPIGLEQLFDLEKESKLPHEERFRLWAGRLQFWRLCSNIKCIRARRCYEARHCGMRFADWAEEVRLAAQAELKLGILKDDRRPE